jgi:hypothetical protein
MRRLFSSASSYEAMADLYDVPVGTVRSRLNAARNGPADELLATAAHAHTDHDALRDRSPTERRSPRSSAPATTASSRPPWPRRVLPHGRSRRAPRPRPRRRAARPCLRGRRDRARSASSQASASPSSSCFSTAHPISRCTAHRRHTAALPRRRTHASPGVTLRAAPADVARTGRCPLGTGPPSRPTRVSRIGPDRNSRSAGGIFGARRTALARSSSGSARCNRGRAATRVNRLTRRGRARRTVRWADADGRRWSGRADGCDGGAS